MSWSWSRSASRFTYQGAKPRTEKKKPLEYKFVDTTVVLHRVGKTIDENTLAFKTDTKMTKPEIKQYIEKLYGLEVTKVNTLIRMGRIKYDHKKINSNLIS